MAEPSVERDRLPNILPLLQLLDSIGTNLRPLAFTVLPLTLCFAHVVAQGNEKIRSSDHAGAIERYDSESSQLAQAYEQNVAYLNKAYADKLKSMTPKLKADIMESVKLRSTNTEGLLFLTYTARAIPLKLQFFLLSSF